MQVSCRCLHKLNPHGSMFPSLHYSTSTLIKSNNRIGYPPNPLLEENKSNKVPFLDWGEKWCAGVPPHISNSPTRLQEFSVVAEMRTNNHAKPGEGAQYRAAVLCVNVTKIPTQPQSQLLPAGPCTSCIKKEGHRYVPCTRQPSTEGAISNLGGWRSARRLERAERRKQKTDPKPVLVCFQVGAVKKTPPCPCKIDQRFSRRK